MAVDGAQACDVLIVGLGPCGATLANHLGLYGIATLAIDSSPEILDYPRAVGLDDEGLRSFQAVGLAEPLLADMLRNTSARYYTASGWCFAHVHPQGQPFGWARRNLFIQPLAERTLRAGIERYSTVSVRTCETLESLDDQGAAGVLAQVRRADGSAYAVRSRYLVGADGGRSTVRSEIGVRLDGKTDAARWLVVDMRNDTLDWPASCVFTDRHQPRMTIELPHGHRRFEFRLFADESDEQAVSEPELERRLAMFYGPGPRAAEVVRARVYMHHSRIADGFRMGNVFLAGDSAHLQPPFFGQGMNSGLRDATNLAWKLAAAVRGVAGNSLLDSYNAERREHARKMVNVATMFGRLYSPRTRLGEMLRNGFFRLVQKLPSLRDYVMQMKFKPMPYYTEGLVLHRTEAAAPAKGAVGRMFMQPLVETTDRRILKLDDAIGPWFALIGIGCDPAAQMSAATRAFWDRLGARLVEVRRSRAIPAPASEGVIVIEDVMSAFRDWAEQNPGAQVIVLRPDRYVAAVAGKNELDAVAAGLQAMLTR
jgi:3-(3-hydroxy-phenyl)propionate hydroxylase